MKMNWRILKGKIETQEQKILISQMVVMKGHHWGAFCWRALCSKSVLLRFDVHNDNVGILSKYWFSKFGGWSGTELLISNKLLCDVNKYHFFPHIQVHTIFWWFKVEKKKQIHVDHTYSDFWHNDNSSRASSVPILKQRGESTAGFR